LNNKIKSYEEIKMKTEIRKEKEKNLKKARGNLFGPILNSARGPARNF
jgi:hypothetical protein